MTTNNRSKTQQTSKKWDLDSEFEFVLMVIVALVVVGMFVRISGFSLADITGKDTTSKPTVTAYADAKASTGQATSR